MVFLKGADECSSVRIPNAYRTVTAKHYHVTNGRNSVSSCTMCTKHTVAGEEEIWWVAVMGASGDTGSTERSTKDFNWEAPESRCESLVKI